jgi:hypothetical protein
VDAVLLAVIAGCEIGFWVLLAAGMVTRYLKHSLAAIFIGCSVGFGHQTIAWADRWAAHLLAGAPRPAKPPKGGRARAIVLVIDGLVSFGYSLRRRTEQTEPV